MESQVLKFKDMPFNYQRAIVVYGGEDGIVDWTVIPEWAESLIIDWLDEEKVQIWIDDYSKVYADRKFKIGMISVEKVKEEVMACCVEYDTFEEYHKWYHDRTKEYHKWYRDGTDHGDSIFPIVLADTGEFIEDGWHRFHSYVDKGLETIPFVEYMGNFPEQQITALIELVK